MSRNQRLLLGGMLSITAIGGWLYLGLRRGSDTVPNEESPVPAAEPPRSALAVEPRDLVAIHDPAEARIPADASTSDRSPESIPMTVKSHTGMGHLRVRAVDAETGSPVQRIRVRAMNDTTGRPYWNATAKPSSSPSSGTYSILVMAKGYEASEPPPQLIEVTGPRHRFRRVAPAKILGTVTGDTWPPDTLWVELVGEGRRSCPVCVDGPSPASKQPPTHGQRWSKSDYCTRCGYAKSSSRLAVPPDGRFEFEHLTSGLYAVRLMDAEERTLCDPKFFVLEIGQSFPLEIRFGAPRRVRIEIVDTDGASLAPEWGARLKDAAADEDEPPTVVHAVQPVDFDCRFRTEHLQIGSSTLRRRWQGRSPPRSGCLRFTKAQRRGPARSRRPSAGEGRRSATGASAGQRESRLLPFRGGSRRERSLRLRAFVGVDPDDDERTVHGDDFDPGVTRRASSAGDAAPGGGQQGFDDEVRIERLPHLQGVRAPAHEVGSANGERLELPIPRTCGEGR